MSLGKLLAGEIKGHMFTQGEQQPLDRTLTTLGFRQHHQTCSESTQKFIYSQAGYPKSTTKI